MPRPVTLIIVAAACSLAVAGSLAGLVLADGSHDELQVGYVATTVLTLVGGALTGLAAGRRRAAVETIFLKATERLSMLAAEATPEDALPPEWVLRALGDPKLWDDLPAGLPERVLDRLYHERLAWFRETLDDVDGMTARLIDLGAFREAREVSERANQVRYMRERAR
jgi:hypothetical protein